MTTPRQRCCAAKHGHDCTALHSQPCGRGQTQTHTHDEMWQGEARRVLNERTEHCGNCVSALAQICITNDKCRQEQKRSAAGASSLARLLGGDMKTCILCSAVTTITLLSNKRDTGDAQKVIRAGISNVNRIVQLSPSARECIVMIYHEL